MGSGQSSAKPAELEGQKAETGTQLFGSWDKPVAQAYALKKQASKKGKAAASQAANAAHAALGSAIDLEAGAGVKPSSNKTPGQQKKAGKAKQCNLSLLLTYSAAPLNCTQAASLLA